MKHTVLAALLAAVVAIPALAGQHTPLPQSHSQSESESDSDSDSDAGTTIQGFIKMADARLVRSLSCAKTKESNGLRRYSCQGMDVELQLIPPNALASAAIRIAPADRKAFLGRLRQELAAACNTFSHRETGDEKGVRSIAIDCQFLDGITSSTVIRDDPNAGILHFVTRMSESPNAGNGDAAK